ncbi:NAD(P)/FAD-dependent oxidoreductase [Sinimarinibacterium thermocellulolyticum]|uniref:FAD/NAD(P)-binding oxidoreductase n=1 Tax=Sinimarinibacterium thermocellulolyticum TaxID=3170016 RepID=A0ABV2A7G5_9GAMM
MTDSHRRHTIAIVGAGAAGLTVAAALKRARSELDVALIDPAPYHYYQPAWTLVGGGCYDIAATRREMRTLIPKGVHHIVERVEGFAPEQNRLRLHGGGSVEYRILIVAAGLQLDWHKIDGLVETLGKNGVSSNYAYEHAPYTWACVSQLRGGTALFTQPAMPIKCAGAPQKALYLAADHLRRRGADVACHFYTAGAAMFGVPFYSQALDKVVAHYGITAHFAHTLVAVDGANRTAHFEVVAGDEKRRVSQRFDFLHVVPPQSAPDFIKHSPLADASGWLAVDKHTLQSPKFDNVFALGDCTTTPNSKTAAAVRAQAPVVVANVLKALLGNGSVRKYDGYASCPLTTSRGKIMLAEFCYDGVVTPSFPLDPRIPRRSYWWLKKHYLPYLYWERMLRGDFGPDWHRERSFPAAVPRIAP